MRLSEESFHLLYERTARPLRAYLLRMLNNPATADDLFQETYLRLLKVTLPSDISDNHLKNYLFRIATNLINDHKSRRSELPLDSEVDLAAHSDPPGGGDVVRMLEELKPAQRQLLWLAYVERFSHFEIAKMLSLKPQSIRPLLSRARHSFALALKRHGLAGE